jgi:hypothetical protein
MVNNQNEFNKKYSKEVKKIEVKRNRNFQGRLVVEDYSELEILNLRDVRSIDKIILKNLPQLQECTIWGCETKELVIENCLQIKKLNVRSNSLTNLEFLVSLENLEEPEVDGNTELVEILKPYQSDWKAYQKDIQEIFKLTNQNNFRGLAKKFWDLKKSREDLKKNVSILLANHGDASKEMNTKELFLNLGKEFKDKEARINYLESRVQELTDLSEKQKEKIIDAFSHLFSEKELLQELITVYLEYIKTKKQGIPSRQLKKECQRIEDELEEKLGEEAMIKIETILNDCENLLLWEKELETKLNDKSRLIEEQKQNPILQTNDSKEKEKLKEQEETNKKQRERQKSLLIAEIQGQLKVYKSLTPIPEEQNKSLVRQLIIQLKEKQLLTSKEQEILDQIKDYLGTKRIFLNARQITIKGLQNCYNKLKGNKKYARADEVGNLISTVGGVADSLAFGIPKACGETVKIINNSFKGKFSDKREGEFQALLINDKEKLFLLNRDIVNKICKDLVGNQVLDLKDKLDKIELFSTKYKIFEINNSIWEGKPFSTTEEMEAAIILLSENWNNLETELNHEENQFKELLNNREQNQQPQILQPTNLLPKK